MTNKSSPVKNQINEIDSPTKTPRKSKNTIITANSMKKNNSFHENNNKQTNSNKKTKKLPNS
jgi:hypothetical protein